MLYIFSLVEILLIIFSISLLYKVFKGPTIIDRVMAADCIDILLGVFMVIYGATKEKSLFLDLGLIVTLLGFIGTILICKYLEGRL